MDARDEDGETPLHWAIRARVGDFATQLLRILLVYGADPDAKNIYGDSSLHMTGGNASLAELLLDFGADARAVNDKSETVLHKIRPNFEFTELLLSRGADVNGHDADGVSVLHSASGYSADADIIELLLDYGADVTARTGPEIGVFGVSENLGQATPLHWAAAANASPEAISPAHRTRR